MRLVAELLAVDARLVHQASLCDGEGRHPLLVSTSRRSVLLAATDARGGARCARLGTRGGGDRNGGSICAEAEVTAGELLERSLILEEDDLAVSLAAELQTHAELGQRRVADVFPLFVHAALAKSTAYPHTPLADRWKHRVAIGFAEEPAAFTCIFEDADRIAVLVSPC